jgi:uncharacterized protein
MNDEEVIASTRRWLEKSVIGLNLCPFAQVPYRADRVRFFVSGRDSAAGLLEDLRSELLGLNAADPNQCETSLLIHPATLNDFLEYNDFLEVCDALLVDLDLSGVLQVASFHPRYRFADTGAEDIENYTNRSPYPMLHLLREASVERAIAAVGDTDEIYRKNIRTMRTLGHEGWRALWGE